MCGIAGIFHYAEPDRPIDRNLLVRMTRTLAHRGPDDEGFHVNGGLGLGHRRLSIVDLSATGAQPMPNEDRSCWITYNGEFYNHASFREGLAAKGHRFRGTSDTETLVHLLEEDGPDCLAGVMGIFGFAFWDGNRQRLTLARDHLGVKQVYYHDNGKRIVFASEIKALLVCPDVPREPDPEGINQYLHFHTALFDRTLYKGIRQLRPGEYLQITRHGVRLRKYWLIDDFQPRGGSPEENVRQLRDQLSMVVGEQLMSDVPVGSFFSGGIDSSAIAAHAIRNGTSPQCFGVYFSDQGVPDERPYQDAAAKALGLSLELTTVDGSRFPDELMQLMYHQDEPVIGAAMFPMYHVSKLAARRVKVCLGGQAGDEVFGGYARYALAHPVSVVREWFHGRGLRQRAVGGNLRHQLIDPRTLQRLFRNARHLGNWETSYFENFAKVPESAWNRVLNGPDLVSREQCRQLFHEVTMKSAATDPADKIMHWDLQTYLPGLFHQDDRMSMAASLESRVPLADPRMVIFALHTRFDLKFRAGASKWVLRKAVSDVLPESILTRRKVGFDTPAEGWMREQHAGFVRDLLLSQHSKNRGMWNLRGIEALLGNPNAPDWFDIVWKLVCLEAWARIFLDGSTWCVRAEEDSPVYVHQTPEPTALPPGNASKSINPRDLAQEVLEDGIGRAAQRVLWEVKMRSGLAALSVNSATNVDDESTQAALQPFNWLFFDPRAVAEAMKVRVPEASLLKLRFLASEATRGRILSFGRWIADCGSPVDWHRNPLNGNRWPVDKHWSKVLKTESPVGDVKLTWEAGRFPQAYLLARAAAFDPDAAGEFSDALFDQIRSFIERNPVGLGVHWNSSQEIVFRLLAWLFGMGVFARIDGFPPGVDSLIRAHALQCAKHVEKNIAYARNFVYNNHLLSEALGLYLAGAVLPPSKLQESWTRSGKSLLEREADRQIYRDGGYIQQSHNYHRVAMQVYLVAGAVARAKREEVPPAWLKAMERSLDFLVAHQNPVDGRLPNYGANDGALPCVLSCCNFSDFRPTLQAVSLATRRERIYEPGPWDEEACWLLGPQALDAPLRPVTRKFISFQHTGHHVLRGQESSSFGAFRCGSLLDRFSQIDMLHLDVWWRGHNVLVDGGSYLYNGPEEWHRYFMCTGSHNTVEVDGRDQMVHLRRFKLIYRTRAKLLHFEDAADWAICAGEHYGYQPYPGECIHRRSVLFCKDDLWIVVDRLEGAGRHRVRLHWLGGDFPYRTNVDGQASLQLETPDGSFHIAVFDGSGNPLPGDVVAGQAHPPRGWLSRYYGEKVPVPSLAVEVLGRLPLTMVSILGTHVPSISVTASTWSVTAGDRVVEFELNADGIVQPPSSTPAPILV
jgi:asparagine synthase (glutamine-hydrolysing)